MKLPAHSFPCPHCSTPLRIRQATHHGRTITCPDCSALIVLEETSGKLVGVVPEPVGLPTHSAVHSPVSFRVLFATLGTVVVAVLIYSLVQFSSATQLTKTETPPDIPPPVSSDSSPPSPEEDSKSPLGEVSVSDRLRKIHQLVHDYSQQNGVYPNGKIFEVDGQPAQFSWIAELMRNQFEDGASLATQRVWNDPVNDAFVRRRLELFQNPKSQYAIGEDRYPTSHFAGVSGIGEDAEKLPPRHPRAGIFSPYRETSLADIIDGTANTIMIVGINSEFGSWARPGNFTLRSFTQEPYLNGPDGIGTGQEDSMLVLMADGSVKTLSKKTSPVIVRRMIAMADGLPLSLETAGDPLTMKEPASMAINPQGQQVAEKDPPIEPLFAPDPPPFDIQDALSQRILSYEIAKPTPLRTLLTEFQELAGVPIDASALKEETLEKQIMLSTKSITLKQLFEQISSNSGIEFKIQPFAIVVLELTPVPDAD